MNIEYFYKFILTNLTKDNEDGFTTPKLIAVLIVTGVIGILCAIALPSFLNPAGKLSIHESKSIYTRLMNQLQQIYFINNNGKFSPSLSKFSIPEETENYSYSIQITYNSAFHYGIAKTDYYHYPIIGLLSRKIPLKSSIGAVFIPPSQEKSPQLENTTIDILCVNNKPGYFIPPKPILENGVIRCAKGTTEFK